MGADTKIAWTGGFANPVKYSARKGDDPSEWDEALRVQEWPVYAGYRGGR